MFNTKDTESVRVEQEAIVAEAQAKLDTITKNHDSILVAIDIDKAQHLALKKEITQLNDNLVTYENSVSIEEQHLSNLKKDIEKAEKELSYFEQNVAAAKVNLEAVKKEQEKTAADSTVEIQSEKAKADKNLSDLKEQADILTESVQKLEKKATLLEEEVSLKLAEVKNLEAVVINLNKEVLGKKEAVDELTQKELGIEKDIALKTEKAETKITVSTRKIEELETKAVFLAEEIKLLEVKKLQVESDVNKITTTFDTVKAELVKAEKDLVGIRQYERHVSAREDHLRGAASELGVEYKEYSKT